MTTLIIDGDALIFGACPPMNKPKVVGNTAYFTVDSTGKSQMPELSEAEKGYYRKTVYSNMMNTYKMLVDKSFADNVLMAVKGEGNFRDDLYDNYKLHRKVSTNHLGPYVKFLREICCFEGIAIPSDGREADDYISIWAEEARAAGEDFIIARVDKDLKAIPGVHYHLKHEEVIHIDEESAKRFYYTQLIAGDPTDKIPGMIGYGPVKAAKLVSDCESDDDFQRTVVFGYQDVYGDAWYEALLLNAKLITLQKHINDFHPLRGWKIMEELMPKTYVAGEVVESVQPYQFDFTADIEVKKPSSPKLSLTKKVSNGSS